MAFHFPDNLPSTLFNLSTHTYKCSLVFSLWLFQNNHKSTILLTFIIITYLYNSQLNYESDKIVSKTEN